jgi:hypothetical protein
MKNSAFCIDGKHSLVTPARARTALLRPGRTAGRFALIKARTGFDAHRIEAWWRRAKHNRAASRPDDIARSAIYFLRRRTEGVLFSKEITEPIDAVEPVPLQRRQRIDDQSPSCTATRTHQQGQEPTHEWALPTDIRDTRCWPLRAPSDVRSNAPRPAGNDEASIDVPCSPPR